MSKDSPFVSEYTEYHKLTKNIFHPSLEPKIKKLKEKLGTKHVKQHKKYIKPDINLARLRLLKFKEKLNDKIFTKLASCSMSPEKQRIIKAKLDNKPKKKVRKRSGSPPVKNLNKCDSVMMVDDNGHLVEETQVSPRIRGRNNLTNSMTTIKPNQPSHVKTQKRRPPKSALGRRQRNYFNSHKFMGSDVQTVISPYTSKEKKESYKDVYNKHWSNMEQYFGTVCDPSSSIITKYVTREKGLGPRRSEQAAYTDIPNNSINASIKHFTKPSTRVATHEAKRRATRNPVDSLTKHANSSTAMTFKTGTLIKSKLVLFSAINP